MKDFLKIWMKVLLGMVSIVVGVYAVALIVAIIVLMWEANPLLGFVITALLSSFVVAYMRYHVEREDKKFWDNLHGKSRY